MGRVAAVVASLVLVAACGDGDDPVVVGGEGSTTRPAPAGGELAIDRCDDLTTLLEEPVDGPLSDDPEVAAGQRNRASAGLPSDEASTRAAMGAGTGRGLDPLHADIAMAFGPLTVDEVDAVVERYQRATAAADDAGSLLGGRPEIGTVAVDPSEGQAVVHTSGDVDALQAELDEALGEGRVRVEATAAGEAELDALRDRVRRHLEARGVSWSGLGSGNAFGRVTVDLEVLGPNVVADLAAAFPDDVELLCVTGADPADVIPDGPQPTEGDGWRLLADEPGAGMPYDTGFAGDADELAALWDEIGLGGEPPAVDFEREVVVWFGPAVSGSCSDIRLDDVVVDAEAAHVYPVIVLPGGNRTCTSDANPHAYVVAVERDRLPAQFAVDLGPDLPETCCPEARTEVTLEN